MVEVGKGEGVRVAGKVGEAVAEGSALVAVG
jgi:hypothetical protein